MPAGDEADMQACARRIIARGEQAGLAQHGTQRICERAGESCQRLAGIGIGMLHLQAAES